MEVEDLIETAAHAVAENCEIRCTVDCFVEIAKSEATSLTRDQALEQIAKRTANKLLKNGAIFISKKVVPSYNIYSTFQDIDCVATCLLVGG